MAELTEEEWNAAVERGRVQFETEPHARAARYDRQSGMVVVDLYNGCTLMVPARQLQGLTEATDDQLSRVEVSGFGYGLHWEDLDADFTVPGLANGRFGTARYMEPRRAQLRALLNEMTAGHADDIAAE